MQAPGYKIIFEGKVAEGVKPETAQSNLQRLLKIDDATTARLFSGKRIVLKKDLTAEMVEKYHAALTRAGVQYSTDPALSFSPGVSAPQVAVSAAGNVQKTLQPDAQPRTKPQGEGPVNPYAPPSQEPVVGKQVFCRSCGNRINETDTTCPKCGARQMVGKPKSKVVAGLLAIFLGFLGAHRFYLGQWVGLVYLLLGLVGWAIALVEGIVFLLTPQERWDRKYGNVVTNGGAGMIIVAALLFIAILGILAAIAIPAYSDYTHRAKVARAVTSIQPAIAKIEAFTLQKGYFPNSNLEADLAADLSTEFVESIVVAENGVLTVTLSGQEGSAIAGETLLWVPRLQGASVRWDCSGGTLPASFRSQDCQTGGYSGQQAVTTSQWVTSEDGVSKIRVPKSWNRIPELTEVAGIEYGHLQREQYLAVISEPKVDFGDGVDLYGFDDIIMEQNFRTSISNLNVRLLGEITLNGMKGVEYELRGSINNIKVVYLYTALEGRDHYHQVLFWTLPSKWPDAQGVFESALSTFAEN